METYKRIIKSNLMPFIVIAIITAFIWGGIVDQTFLDEGFRYFAPAERISLSDIINFERLIHIHDVFGRLFFTIFVPVFKDNIQLYLVLQLIVMILLNFVFFYVLKYLTKSTFFSVVASIFFLAGYIGYYDIMATGTFHRFVHRMPNLIPTLFSFYFLIKFFRENKIKHYFYSLLLFTSGFLLGHYSTYLSTIIISYPIFVSIFSKKNVAGLIKSILVSLSFLALNSIIYFDSNQRPEVGFLDFILKERYLFSKVMIQVSNTTIPVEIIKSIGHTLNDNFPFSITSFLLGILLILIYIVGLYFVIRRSITVSKKQPEIPALFIASIITLIINCIFNLYFQTINPLVDIGRNRHYFMTAMMASIIWSLLLWGIVITKKSFYKIVVFIIIAYLIFNANLIFKQIDYDKYKFVSMKSFITYINSIRPSISSDNLYIVTRPEFVWTVDYLRYSLSKPNTELVILEEGWQQDLPKNKNNTFVIDYTYKFEPDGSYSSSEGVIVDKTEDYRFGRMK